MQLPYPSHPVLGIGWHLTHDTCVSVQLEGFSRVGKGQTWGRGAQTLHCIEGFLPFLCPLNFLFLMGCIVTRNLVIEGMVDFGITPNEASIVVHESQNASQLCNCDGKRAVLDSLDFMTISLYTLLGNPLP